MSQRKIPAVFMRGGTSRALVFHDRDLPADPEMRDRVFLRAMGSPDPNHRQLDGLGGGISSTSKVCVLSPSPRPDADVDFTFGQVSVDQNFVDYRANCGNMSSAMGPFSMDEGLVPPPPDGETLVRIHNTNTQKVIHSRFLVKDGVHHVEGDFAIPGVAGTNTRVTLDFLDPGGAATGKLLPTGAPAEKMEIEGVGTIEASLVDATNPVVFVRAKDLGMTGTELPAAIDNDTGLMVNLEQIRAEAAVRMGLAPDRKVASERMQNVPKIGVVAPPADYIALSGESVRAEACHIVSRMISMGNTHRAYALTAAMCLSVAARIPGTLVHEAARQEAGDLLLGHASGVQPFQASVVSENGSARAEKVTVYRTARRLMEGFVCVPAGLFEGAAVTV